MAASMEQIFRYDAEECSNGHNIHYSFTLRDLVHWKSWPYTAEFNVSCSVRPTSWSLAVTYKQVPETGEISCVHALSRTDQSMDSVEASIKVGLLDCKNLYVVYPKLMGTKQMFGAEYLHGTFKDTRPAGHINFAMSQDLILRISILIRTCHLTEDFDRQKYFTKAMGDMSSSKTK